MLRISKEVYLARSQILPDHLYLDGDGDVDWNDMNIILAARNSLADGPNDPSDLDGDGRISGLNARKLVTLCTRPRCARE